MFYEIYRSAATHLDSMKKLRDLPGSRLERLVREGYIWTFWLLSATSHDHPQKFRMSPFISPNKKEI